MRQICVVYEETRNGRNALRMAVDAARAFGESNLQVFVAIDERVDTSPTQQSLMRIQRIVADVANEIEFTLVPFTPPTAPFVPQNALLILPRASKPAEDGGDTPPRLSETFATTCGAVHGAVDVLMPADETTLEERGTGPILVPFSDGETGLVAATAAIDLALRWRKKRILGEERPEVFFYHTTWPDPNGLSTEAIDQMCTEATRVMLAMEAAANQAGVRYKTIVETHDDVVQGVIEMAQNTHTVLIMMARGARIRQGSYVGRTLQQSSIPVYIAKSDTPRVSEPAGDDSMEAFRDYRREMLRAQADNKQRVPLWRRIANSRLVSNPMFVAAVVAIAYIAKATAKIGVGSWINSPMISGDGFHNIADVLEVIAIGVVLFIAARQASDRYPYGRKNMEWFTQLGIGIGLFLAAGNFIVACCVGLLSYVPVADHAVRGLIPWLPAHEGVALNGHTFPWVLGVTAISFCVSLVLSRYQIMVGKRTGHASLIANGEEAASDGWIEAVTVFGVIAEYVTGWGFLEYILGLVVAVMVLRTGKELFLVGWRVLLQHSIGADHEDAIRAACGAVRGICGVKELKTFQVGHTAVVMVTCETLAGSHGTTYIKKGVESAIRSYVLADDSDFKGADIHVKMQRPDPRRHRIGYGVFFNPQGVAVLAPAVGRITHVAVCDVEHDDIVRSKLLPLSGIGLAELTAEKRIQRLYVFDKTIRLQPPVSQASTPVLPVLGLTV
jgi:cation diffusion facilitator family transporter